MFGTSLCHTFIELDVLGDHLPDGQEMGAHLLAFTALITVFPTLQMSSNSFPEPFAGPEFVRSSHVEQLRDMDAIWARHALLTMAAETVFHLLVDLPYCLPLLRCEILGSIDDVHDLFQLLYRLYAWVWYYVIELEEELDG